MKTFTAVIEKCSETRQYVGYVPGFSGAHSQADTLEELQGNLREVVTMLLEEKEEEPDQEFVGLQTIALR